MRALKTGSWRSVVSFLAARSKFVSSVFFFFSASAPRTVELRGRGLELHLLLAKVRREIVELLLRVADARGLPRVLGDLELVAGGVDDRLLEPVVLVIPVANGVGVLDLPVEGPDRAPVLRLFRLRLPQVRLG